MARLKLGFTERRRASLARKFDRIEKLEIRNTITEPISVLGLSVSAFRGLAQLGIAQVHGGGDALDRLAAASRAAQQRGVKAPAKGIPAPGQAIAYLPIAVGSRPGGGWATGGGARSSQPIPASSPVVGDAGQTGNLLDLSPASSAESTEPGVSTPWKPAAPAGGGAALPPRGGSGGLSPPKAAARGTTPSPGLPASTAGASNAGGSAALLAAAAGAAGAPGAAGNGGAALSAPAPSAHALPAAPSTPGSPPSNGHRGPTITPSDGPGGTPAVSGGATPPGSIPDPVLGNASGPSQNSFPYFPVYVLDVNDGVVLFPGVDQLATLRGSVILQAQVSGTTVSTYNWNTSGISSDATSISGGSTYQLTFQWTNDVLTGHVDPITLSLSDSNSHTETYTYDFEVPAGDVSSSGGGGNATWPQSLSPDTVSADDTAWASDGALVDSNSGSLQTAIALPTYNPNVPAIGLTYDSVSANPLPIIIAENTLSASGAVPSQVSATLTFNGTAGTTYYYNTSTLTPGDVQQIALQANAASLATGRYSYSVQVVDHGTTNTTITLSGTATVLNESSSALGDGWTLDGLEQIIPASGGAILSLGGGDSLWFSGSFGSGGGTYTSPAGDFSTLVKNSSGGTYTRTLSDGTEITFNSGGYETATIDLNGNHVTFSYNGSNQVTSVTDPYAGVTTLTYSGGYLQTIKDPAARLTTFTMSGGSLAAVQQADGTRVSYTYDSAGRMTKIQDPLLNVVTVSYDSAERVGTMTRPDASTEEFSAFQEQGWTNSGTSGSPAPVALLAASAATYTDPNGNVTSLRPDWYGLGMPGVAVDALGDVATDDLNSSGLPIVAIDQVNRISQYTYDSKGNITTYTYPDLSTNYYTYNTDSEPLTFTNENNYVTSYTYDGHGNNAVIQDPLNNRTTMTYTSTGQLQTLTDANNHTTTYLYDSQDRLTTIVNADGTTKKLAYDNQGDLIKITDERNNSTTFSFDALNRETGTTDALGDQATLVYDADGNLTQDLEPTPTGQTARTTVYTYNSMNEVTVATDPLGLATSFGYDPAGNQTWVKDPMGRITTTVFDALNRPTVVIDPMGNSTTTVYDADSETTQVIDPMGRTTTITFSNRGWVPTVTDPLNKTTTYSYTPTGQTLSSTQKGASGGSEPYTYGYNADDELITVSDPLLELTSFSYDGVGNQVSVTDPNNNITTYSYDSTSELTTITDALGHTTVYGYDASGNQQTVTDALGHTSTVLYDALNRATTIASATGGTTTIAYDAAGRETSLTDAVGNKTQWAYDADDRVTTLTEPNGHTVTYVYDSDGEVTDTTDADGRRTTYSYNADGDQTAETWVGASPLERVTYTYDADNEMTGASDSYATLTFTYDGDGHVQTAAASGPGSGQPNVLLSYTYDPAGNETSLTDNVSSAGLTTYTYNGAERLTQVATAYGGTAGPQVGYSHDSGGRITSELRTIGGSGTSVNTSFSYDVANRQTTITHQAVSFTSGGGGGLTTTPLATYVYSYDNANRVTTQMNAEGTYTYTYDNANELTGVDKNDTQVESYGYDLNGNRTGTGYSTTVMNETASSPGISYTYDNAGNMISANNGSTTTTYTYDYRNRLTEVTQGGTTVATYVYDALNRRIGIDDSSSQTWTVYDGTNPYADFNGSGTLQERYQYGPSCGWCDRGPATRANQLRRHDGLVLARQAGFGARHCEHVGDGARPCRLRQLRQHRDGDQRGQR